MKKMFKKFFASLMVSVMVLSAAPLSGFVGLELNLDWLNFDWLDFIPKASAASYSGTCGDNLTWTLYDDGELVISGTGDMRNYSYSSEASWYSYRLPIITVTIGDGVTSIGDYVFSGCRGLTSVTIPDSVTNIGKYAFNNCRELTELTMPISAKIYNSSYTFSGCTNIDKITLTKGNGTAQDYVTSTSSSATNTYYGYTPWYISGCSEIVIADGVTGIGLYTFYDCTDLTSVTIPDSVTSIGSYAFSNCRTLENVYYTGDVAGWCAIYFNSSTSNPMCYADNLYIDSELVTELVIPDSVTSIKKYAFYGCTGLTSVTIPDSVASIGDYAFYRCSGITELTMPISAKIYNSSNTFGGCTNIKKITLTKGNGTAQNYDTSTSSSATDTYYQYTPWYISSCSEVVLADGVTSVASNTFKGCTGLTSITIPDSVTSINEGVFNDTGYYNDTSNWEDGVLYINNHLIKAESSVVGSYTIKTGTKTINKNAFNGCTELTSITIPDSVTSIGDSIFYGCTGLTNVTIPDNVTSIGNSAFYGCTGLTGVTIPDSVTSIGNYAFYGCTDLTSVTIPDSVTSIGYSAFKDCTNLISVTIGNSVTSIGYSAFSGCTNLESITIPDSVTSIGEGAFLNCTDLTSVTIPDSVTSIGDYTFYGCSGITELTMPISVKIYYEKASYSDDYYSYSFSGCTNIEKITLTKGDGTVSNYSSSRYKYTPWYISGCSEIVIEDGATAGIGSYTFYGCTGLTSVAIGNGVTSIGNYAFYNCTGLTSITIPDSVTSIGDNAFYFCTGLTSVTIGNGVTSIGDDSFFGCDNITSIIIPDSVTSIGSSAFSSCDSLTSITIPDSVTSIGSSAFRNCYYLVLDLFKDSYAETYAINNGLYYCYMYHDGEEKIFSVSVTSKFSFEINKETNTMTVTSSGNMPSFTETDLPWLQYKPYIKHIVINDGCTSISDNAFKNLRGLQSVTIPGSIMSIGSEAFYDCRSLVKIYYTGDVSDWCSIIFSDYYANPMYYADSFYISGEPVTELFIPDSVTSIGNYAFYNFKSLTNVTIGNKVTSIGNYAFNNCSGITELTLPISAKLYNYGVFSGCTNIKKITITKGNGTVQNGTSSNYSNTPWYVSREKCTEIIVEDGVVGIGNYMFYGCSNIGNVTLPISVKSIGNNAFTGCQNIGKLKVYNKNCTFGTEATSYYTTIVGYASSTAEVYANKMGFDFELITDNDHEHIYSNSCDAECNLCGHTRTDLVHTYSSVCDITCDLCTYKRTDVVHTYSNDCDPECDVCGYTRTELTHTYDNDCDTECNYCDFVRTPNHTDDNNDGLCDVCEKALSDILIGVEQNFKVKVGETVYIKFVPANSGVYTFFSSSSTDTYGYVFNADKNTLASDDDSGGNGQFSITYTFKSGTVYYLGVKYYNSSNSGEIPVTIRLDRLICDHNHTHEEHQDSTCTENGYDKVICDDCGQTVSTAELPLLDHDYKTITAPPTCLDEGTVVCLCRMCRDAYISEILDPLGHSELVWVTVKVPSTRNEGIMNQVCPACGEVFDTKTVPAISLSADSTANIDFETNTISGFVSGSSSIGDYLSATNNGYTFTCESEKIATGTVITLTAGEETINEFEAVIFGDTNGDGWYDGQDAIIVDCLANGMLTKEDVGEAVYTAADCNHDGVIDQLDVDLLNQAGTLLANVDQSKPAEVLLETSSEYVEYISLIDQSHEIEVEDDLKDNVEIEPDDSESSEQSDILSILIRFFERIFEMILSFLTIQF